MILSVFLHSLGPGEYVFMNNTSSTRILDIAWWKNAHNCKILKFHLVLTTFNISTFFRILLFLECTRFMLRWFPAPLHNSANDVSVFNTTLPCVSFIWSHPDKQWMKMDYTESDKDIKIYSNLYIFHIK